MKNKSSLRVCLVHLINRTQFFVHVRLFIKRMNVIELPVKRCQTIHEHFVECLVRLRPFSQM